MPPFSLGANGALPNSRNSYWPIKPCHAAVVTHGGSMRPVEGVVALAPGPVLIDSPLQSASPQYTEPGKRRLVGRLLVSVVPARFAAMLLFVSAGPPASYTTCTPVGLYRVESVSIRYQLKSGNISLKLANPFRSVLLKLEKLPSRKRTLVDTSARPCSSESRTPLPFLSK